MAMKGRAVYASRYNVLEAAKQRIRFIYEEFEGDVSVSVSGGKDSTVVLELACQVAKELGIDRVHAMWLDQECEFEATVDYMRKINAREDIDLDWYQVPFKLFNSTNHADPWLRVWDPDPAVEWVREKEPDSIHENTFTDYRGRPIERFTKLLGAINKSSARAHLTGVRAEESPGRTLGVSSQQTYKYVTWGSKGLPKNKDGSTPFYLFHPLYDWRFPEIWKAIHEHGWDYNDHYNTQFRMGVPTRQMRVSNYHHETALHALTVLQEIEPETWERATRRLAGVNSYSHLSGGDLLPKTLPYMFENWDEYLRHLIDNLNEDEEHRKMFYDQYAELLRRVPPEDLDTGRRMLCRYVIDNDLYGTKLDNYLSIVGRKRAEGIAAAERSAS